MDAVTPILVERAQEREGPLARMACRVAAVHAVVLPVVLISMVAAPVRSRGAADAVMTVSLGGAPGPRSGGMTPMSARAAEAAPPDDRSQRRLRPPAAEGAARWRCRKSKAQDATAEGAAEEGAGRREGASSTPKAAEASQRRCRSGDRS